MSGSLCLLRHAGGLRLLKLGAMHAYTTVGLSVHMLYLAHLYHHVQHEQQRIVSVLGPDIAVK